MDRATAELSLQGITHRVAGNQLFADVTVTVRSGQTLLVSGRNGAGKSTFLRIASGLQCPTSGAVRLTRADNRAPSIAGVWSGSAGLYPKLTASENFQYRCRLHGFSHAEIRSRRDRLFDRLSLSDRAKAQAGDLSTGEKMRLAVAIAIAAEADLVVLDEPDAGIDRHGVREVGTLIREELGRQIVLLATHNHELGSLLATDVLALPVTVHSMASRLGPTPAVTPQFVIAA